jgi:hypothetical protein
VPDFCPEGVDVNIDAIVTAFVTSSGLIGGGIYWFGKKVVDHLLLRSMEDRKSELSQRLETYKLDLNRQLEVTKAELQLAITRDKAGVEGAVRQEVETQLGDAAALRQYEYEAKRRLYLAIGPLKFQLLLACRDLVARIDSYSRQELYPLNIDRYYGRSTLYRILRPIAISELIERQVSVTDFSVDPGAVDCLRFRRTATRLFSGDDIVCDHPSVNWNAQEQHVYADGLTRAAQALIEHEQAGDRILRFDEFNERLNVYGPGIVAPFGELILGFTATNKPILWVRLVAFANSCNALIGRLGVPMGFAVRTFDASELLPTSEDAYLRENGPRFFAAIKANELVAL